MLFIHTSDLQCYKWKLFFCLFVWLFCLLVESSYFTLFKSRLTFKIKCFIFSIVRSKRRNIFFMRWKCLSLKYLDQILANSVVNTRLIILWWRFNIFFFSSFKVNRTAQQYLTNWLLHSLNIILFCLSEHDFLFEQRSFSEKLIHDVTVSSSRAFSLMNKKKSEKEKKFCRLRERTDCLMGFCSCL